MDDNSLSIDLKKLRKNLPPPPVPVAPLNTGLPVPPRPVSSPMPPVSKAPALPPKPAMRILGKKLPPLRYILIAAIAIAILAGGYYIYGHFWKHSPFGPTPGPVPEQAAATSTDSTLSEADIVSRVGKLMLLPSEETPTLAKVSDPSALQGQVFFKNAVTGDIVLMYTKALRAILYDPAQNKIIEVGPITDASSTTTALK